jgi:hypothetical protein
MRLFPNGRQGHQTLLPADAYPNDPTTGKAMSDEKRTTVDRKLRALPTQYPLPTEPGEYLDGTGDHWVLDGQGGWTDHHGVHRDARYAPLLVLLVDKDGPLVRLEDR